ncbi:thioredoxin family protein [Paraflavitalea sp. CAU 1676]|uniref:thioredoxin family protein n=1 Tax=Paraflavitalea sp. CAU 1676 TaxID=3032598 RepID=UPI0023DBDDCE|nr:thioredoxin family protein [Paraflavitalea sp. CAU 1676]MDF2192602.1 thioredoxin family protein [Paraflavitalea sp. CAU 1676]
MDLQIEGCLEVDLNDNCLGLSNLKDNFMKKAVCLLVCSLYTFTSIGQNVGRGVDFEVGLSWQEIVDKASSKGKSIFVEIYATWCGPCKVMDKLIYPNDKVGSLVNDKFISVKVQVDTGKLDNGNVKKTYPIARYLESKFNLSGVPTFLFFSPDGKIIHKDEGYKEYTSFVKMVKDALDTTTQIYGLVDRWRSGGLSYWDLPKLVKRVLYELNEEKLASEIASDYLRRMEFVPVDSFVTRDNLFFLRSFNDIHRSSDRMFRVCVQNSDLVDSTLKQSAFAMRFISFVMTKEEINPAFEKARRRHLSPNWNKIRKLIARKCGEEMANYCEIRGKEIWYQNIGDNTNYVKWLVRKITFEGVDNEDSSFNRSIYLNNAAWQVFQKSNDRSQLIEALKWVNKALRIVPVEYGMAIDTKANLLYKLGDSADAIALEEELVEKTKNESYRKTLSKMKLGLETWDE